MDFVGQNLGYGTNLLYAISKSSSGFSTLYTISTSAAVTARFGLGYGFNSLAFSPTDLGYGTNLLYGLAADSSGFSSLYSINTNGAVVNRLGVGRNVHALTFPLSN